MIADSSLRVTEDPSIAIGQLYRPGDSSGYIEGLQKISTIKVAAVAALQFLVIV